MQRRGHKKESHWLDRKGSDPCLVNTMSENERKGGGAVEGHLLGRESAHFRRDGAPQFPEQPYWIGR
jgi:hypothetical protein